MLSKGYSLIFFILLLLTACHQNKDELPKSVEEFLKNQGVKEMQVDLNYQSPDFPDKKYISLTVTYNFSSAEGKPQKEFLGYILKRDGQDWVIEKGTSYTKTGDKAKEYLAGKTK